MDKNEPDLVEQLHREAVQRRREQEAAEHALVEAMFREARERLRQEEEHGNALVELGTTARPWTPPAESTAADGTADDSTYSELPEARPDSGLYTEWGSLSAGGGTFARRGE